METNTPSSIVHNVDCLDFLREQPDASFDLAIADPPYFSGPERRSYFGSRVSKNGVNRVYRKTPRWEVPTSEFFDELRRVARHYIVFGCNYYEYQFSPGRIVWDKCNGQSSYSDCELAATDLFESVRMFRYMWNGMMQGKSIAEGQIMRADKSKNEKRIHPTQKPVLLYIWLLETFAKPGWRILDTHLGSGSSRIAAYQLGFDFTACEIDAGYVGLQQRRFEESCLGRFSGPSGLITSQLQLFDNTQNH